MNNLTITIGKDERNLDIGLDFSAMKHLLVAGCTGSGKSILLHNIISKLVAQNDDVQLKLILIDLKRVELSIYKKIPHLLTPVIIEPKKAILAMKWTLKEIHRRYDVFEECGTRDIDSHNNSKPSEVFPSIFVVIDEFADLMHLYSLETEQALLRIAEAGHNAGVHLILSTSTPNTKIVTNSIRSLFGGRIAFQLASAQDSKVIIGSELAYNLRKSGEMFFQSGTFKYPVYGNVENVNIEKIKFKKSEVSNSFIYLDEKNEYDDNDELYEQAKAYVLEAGKASTSYLQRKMRIGYARAARLMDLLECREVVVPADGSKPHEIVEGKK